MYLHMMRWPLQQLSGLILEQDQLQVWLLQRFMVMVMVNCVSACITYNYACMCVCVCVCRDILERLLNSHALSLLRNNLVEDGFVARVGSVLKDEREGRAFWKT